MYRARTLGIVGTIAFGIGIAVCGVGDLGTDIRSVGLLLLVAVIVRITIAPALRPQIEIFEDAYEQGRDRGYQEGRRVGHPTVVHLRAPEIERHAYHN